MEDDNKLAQQDYIARQDRSRSKDSKRNAQPFSAFNYPYGIPPPTYSYLGAYPRTPALSDSGFGTPTPAQGSRSDDQNHAGSRRLQKRRVLADSIMDWYSMSRSGIHEVPQQSDIDSTRDSSDGGDSDDPDSEENITNVRGRGSIQSNVPLNTDRMDLENSRSYCSSGQRSDEDSETETLRRMDYKTRRKHIQRVRIQFNVSGTSLGIPSSGCGADSTQF